MGLVELENNIGKDFLDEYQKSHGRRLPCKYSSIILSSTIKEPKEDPDVP